MYKSLDGAALTLSGGSVAEIENYLFLPLWNQIKASPTAIMVSAAQAQEIANLILSQPSAVTYLQTDESGRANVTAGGRIGSLVNAPAGGVTVPIEVHTSLPPGHDHRQDRPGAVPAGQHRPACWSTGACGTPPSSTTASPGSPTRRRRST